MFLSGYISYLQVTITYVRPWISLKFGQIRQLVSMATNRVIMEKKTVLSLFLCCFNPILFILAGNDDMHNSSEEFEFLPDPTTDCAVSCPWASEKAPLTYNGKFGVATFPKQFLIKSFSYFQVTMTYIRAWMGSKFGQILSGITELAALEHLKSRCCHFF